MLTTDKARNNLKTLHSSVVNLIPRPTPNPTCTEETNLSSKIEHKVPCPQGNCLLLKTVGPAQLVINMLLT